jgi:hypothetical protein
VYSCSFSNIDLLQYRLLLFVSYLAVRLLTKFWDTGNVCLWKVLRRGTKTGEITSVLVSSSASAVIKGYGCKNSVFSLLSSFCA